MKTLGIIGGSSPVATVEYYRIINAGIQKRLGGVSSGEIIISSIDFGKANDFIANDQWDEATVYLNKKAKGLEQAGAELILFAANTWHKVVDGFMKDVRIPFLHIVDPTGRAIQKAHLKKVALLGTKPTMAYTFLSQRYTAKFGIEILVPSPEEQDVINRIIFIELSQGNFRSDSKAYYFKVMDRLAEGGAQGVILGCTEIPLLINQADRPALPMFDSTTLFGANSPNPTSPVETLSRAQEDGLRSDDSEGIFQGVPLSIGLLTPVLPRHAEAAVQAMLEE
ncbi:uncharacterized protein KY384_003226 [Bacidia gigantensis]|uniref:uncharacterized protein n=1 Tax=Bacidia gigantensis TaxID=2732470 RepID=UPI001D0488C5|nr:uncharacterized protein KY384_003226 [Bacidia gigantensis]KAG8531596.1 hypothetical protein KY384_003226 [Bacidia gigantensis]